MTPCVRRLWMLATLLVPAAPVVAAEQDTSYTRDFALARCDFSNRGANLYFNLEPGRRSVFEGEEDGEQVRVETTNLCETRTITFTTATGETLRVMARVVEERELADGELVEVSRNFFARCRQTDDVFYFGEDVDIFEDGEVASHEGAWLAGADGALPGLIMPGTFLLGSRYFQEVAEPVALDRAEHVAEGLDVDVPAGRFERCVRVRETTTLEPGVESVKEYCPTVGLTRDDTLELIEHARDRGCGPGRDAGEDGSAAAGPPRR